MKPISIKILASMLCCSAASDLLAQGCVAIRGGSCAGSLHGLSDPHTGYLQAGEWQASLGYRWLHSDRHFRGDHEEPARQENETEVVNDSHFFDVGIQYAITARYSVAAVIPFVYSDRSSLYEHGVVNGRHHSSSGGLGDVRLMGYAWVWNPDEMPKGNLLLGIGPKFPTGDYKATDIFYNRDGDQVIGYVDQSIQPGDGGWGFMAELFGFREIHPGTSLYLQGAYLFNPENVNGTPTQTGILRNPFERVMSIPDQYLGRAGVNYALFPEWGLSISLGGRIEGVPVRDAIGKNDGFRRPGYAVSIEPGVSWMKGGWTVAVTTPVAVYRNRERSVSDLRQSRATGNYVHGDAAFADFTVNASIAFRF